MNFMRFMAQELREYMAKLGVRTVDELVGRTDLLKVKSLRPQVPAPARWICPAFLQNPYGREPQRTFQPEGCLQLPAGKDARHEGADEEVQEELRYRRAEAQHRYAGCRQHRPRLRHDLRQ